MGRDAAASGIRFVLILDAAVDGTALWAMTIKVADGFLFFFLTYDASACGMGTGYWYSDKTSRHIIEKHGARSMCFEACIIFLRERDGYAIESQRIKSVQASM